MAVVRVLSCVCMPCFHRKNISQMRSQEHRLSSPPYLLARCQLPVTVEALVGNEVLWEYVIVAKDDELAVAMEVNTYLSPQ